MAFPAQPEPAMIDDIQLRVELEDGTVFLPDQIQNDGRPTAYFANIVDTNNTTAFPSNNETTVGLNIPWDELNGSSYIDVEVVARFVQPGGNQGAVGLDGDAVGFALVVKGVDRDSADYLDDDQDGVVNIEDKCPTEDARLDDDDDDGCLDDDDQDAIPNIFDDCPTEDAEGFDQNGDGCLDDSDGDTVSDNIDACETPDLAWPVNGTGCYPLDEVPMLTVLLAPEPDSILDGEIIVAWAVDDGDGDGYEVAVEFISQQEPSITLLSCVYVGQEAGSGQCQWTLPDEFPPFYKAGARYALEITMQTTNRSPAAEGSIFRLNASHDLLIPLENKTGTIAPSTDQDDDGPGIFVFIGLGLLAGMLVTKWLSAPRDEEREEREPPPPFALQKETAHHSRVLVEENE